MAAEYVFIPGSSDFGSPASWEQTYPPVIPPTPAGPPGASDLAEIFAAEGAVDLTGDGSAGTLEVAPYPGGVTVDGADLQLGELDVSTFLAAALTIDSGTIDISSAAELGGSALTTTMNGGAITGGGTVYNFGTLQVDGGSIAVDQVYNDNLVTVATGGSLTAQTYLFDAGTEPTEGGSFEGSSFGSLAVTGGWVEDEFGVVGLSQGTSAQASVGGGGEWTNSDGLTIGDLDAPGTLLVTNGTVSVGSGPSGELLDGLDAAGSININGLGGSGGTLLVSGTADIGDATEGDLGLSSGGVVQVAGLLDSGALGGATGSLDVANGGTLQVQGNWIVGDAGQHSDEIDSGANVSVSGNLTVGAQSSGNGSLTVLGNGEALTVNGDATVGAAGSGALLLGAGATLAASSGVVGIGTGGGTGSLDIPSNALVSAVLGTIGPTGTVSMEGGAFNAGSIVVQSGELYGNGFVFGAVTNNGSITANGGTLLFQDNVGGSGVLAMAGADLRLMAGMGSGQTVSFSGGDLLLDNLGASQGLIEGFGAGDTITLNGVTADGETFADGQLALTSGTVGVGTLSFQGAYTTNDFLVTPVSGGTEITATACYAAGTRIMTRRGEVAVEHLAEGDFVMTHDGRAVPVQWIGYRHVDCQRHKQPDKVWPVRVSAGAFGDNLPRRDLWLSPDHAVFVDEVLIPIKRLVNGSSIEQVPRNDVTYYHVELPQHDVILAEGLAAESYLDTGDRASFANGGAVMCLFADFSPRRVDAATLWEAEGYAPLIVSGPALEAARQRLIGRVCGIGVPVRTDACGDLPGHTLSPRSA